MANKKLTPMKAFGKLVDSGVTFSLRDGRLRVSHVEGDGLNETEKMLIADFREDLKDMMSDEGVEREFARVIKFTMSKAEEMPAGAAERDDAKVLDILLEAQVVYENGDNFGCRVKQRDAVIEALRQRKRYDQRIAHQRENPQEAML